jgi:hypothetical protein
MSRHRLLAAGWSGKRFDDRPAAPSFTHRSGTVVSGARIALLDDFVAGIQAEHAWPTSVAARHRHGGQSQSHKPECSFHLRPLLSYCFAIVLGLVVARQLYVALPDVQIQLLRNSFLMCFFGNMRHNKG